MLPLITMMIDGFYRISLGLMLNIHEFQCGLDLLTTLFIIVGDSDLVSIYIVSTPC